jgi:hypothetical protein
MPTESHSFKRLVLGLQPNAPDRSMQLAVELAELLNLELLGLFLEDANLRNLAGIPFAREFRPLGGGWQPIDLTRLTRDLELAARSAERLFADAAKRLSTSYQFEVIRGLTAETIASVSRTGDIVMVFEPVSAAERATQQFAWLIEAAFRSAAAVMLVPTHITRTTGPVVAIVTAPDDPGLDAAAAFANAAEEELVVVEAYAGAADDPRIRNLAAETGLTIRRVATGRALPSDPKAFLPAFHELQERLVVVTRGVLTGDLALTIASARAVPVLVVEPPERIDGGVPPRSQTAA